MSFPAGVPPYRAPAPPRYRYSACSRKRKQGYLRGDNYIPEIAGDPEIADENLATGKKMGNGEKKILTKNQKKRVFLRMRG